MQAPLHTSAGAFVVTVHGKAPFLKAANGTETIVYIAEARGRAVAFSADSTCPYVCAAVEGGGIYLAREEPMSWAAARVEDAASAVGLFGDFFYYCDKQNRFSRATFIGGELICERWGFIDQRPGRVFLQRAPRRPGLLSPYVIELQGVGERTAVVSRERADGGAENLGVFPLGKVLPDCLYFDGEYTLYLLVKNDLMAVQPPSPRPRAVLLGVTCLCSGWGRLLLVEVQGERRLAYLRGFQVALMREVGAAAKVELKEGRPVLAEE